MRSGRRMSRSLLWLLAFLAFSSLSSLVDGSALKVMSAPNLMRVGTVENIFVECLDCVTEDVTVEIIVRNHPTKNKRLALTSVILNQANKFQDLAHITIPAEDFSKDPSMKQYVFLTAKFPDVELEKVVLVSFQSGYIFIQTDKTLYTPNSVVNYRIFALTPSMTPVERTDGSSSEASISTEIETPDGIILQLGQVSLKSGMYSGIHKFTEMVSPGVWKLVAKFQNNPQHSYSAEFEVKEYVLPSFEVKLTTTGSFFHVDSTELTINIKATYLFGERVNGVAYVVFGVIHEGQKRSFPGSLQRVPIEKDQEEVTLRREHITQTFQNIHELVGSSIYVSVSVLTDSGSEMVEAELRGIQIVTSPYTIHFRSTPKYFKPGMPFDVLVEVVNPDGTPAQDIEVIVDPDEQSGTTAANGMARLFINTDESAELLTITAKTNDPDIPNESQASATMTARPYETQSKSYIHIGVDAEEIKLKSNLKVSLNLKKPGNAQSHVTYLILSRGQLVKYGKHKKRSLISMRFTITKEMLPSFRIVAYYFTNEDEVVSDSLWVDVEDSCMGSLKLEQLTPTPSYEPRRMFDLKVTGDPEATVGLVAVDNGVYVLNNKHRLTQKKIWDIVEKQDTGCTPGGGRDSMSVFYDAGLLFVSNRDSGSPYRQELKCPAASRRKRASTIVDVRTSLVSLYQDELQRECCVDGMRETPLSYTCERRSKYINDGPACTEAFLHCCKELETQRAERREESLMLARSEDDDSYMDSNEITSRTQFPESWLWSDIKLPACQNLNCDTTSMIKSSPLPDSITTWQFTGISLSRTHGICVGDPLGIIVRKKFFIDLRLPYSAVRGEQIEVKAVLYNYSPERITVRVDLIETQHVCSSASKRGKYRQEVDIGPQKTRSVPFIVIPMKNGQLNIEVKAAVKYSFLKDGIMKNLLVVPPGILTKSLMTKVLDPARIGVDGKQIEIMNSAIPEADLVPNTPTSTHISVTGREQISALVENAISGNSLGTLIIQPSGCGEQNMITMTLPVIATMYLDKTNQWESVGIDKRSEALQHIRTGYQNELAYRKNDGGFAVFKDYKSSTWLTAYVAKVFAMAYKLVKVQPSVICDAIKFLILNTQQPDGSFTEVGIIIHGEMIGDVRGKDSDVSLTAFCLIAMQESREICLNSTITSLTSRINKAVAYLEGRQYSLVNSYAAALTSYALANENKLDQRILSKFVSSGLNYWPVSDSHLFTLEATAYALLALVKAKAWDDARHVVRWFNQQQIDGGGYGSTQATIMVYQAIAEYWIRATEQEYHLHVNIDLPGRKKLQKFDINKNNHYATRTTKFNNINQDVTVTVNGSGEATVKMVSLYYALPKEKESNCNKFSLSVQLNPEKMTGDEKVYKLIIKVLYKDEHRDATMSILDIGMLTGYTVNTNDLDSLSKGRAHIIARYEMDTVLSKRGSLIIYLDKVSHTDPEEIAFRIHQKMKVGVLQPAAVSVYEYYNHQHNNQTACVKFYHPVREAGELLRLCTQAECICAEENCSMQKTEKIDNSNRTTKACESEQNSKVDYVYKVKVENFTDALVTDIYTMQVVEVIKEGTYDDCKWKAGEVKKTCDVGPQGTRRTFRSYKHCRNALNLKIGKTYLIMGLARDIHMDEEQKTPLYVLGERTWIEYWPTAEECETEEHRDTCEGMEELVQTTFRCPGK